jgi:diguanylate cyclase (GGDEF)-like protein
VRALVSDATRPDRSPDPFFASYVALAIGLVGDLTGICLLDGSLRSRGKHGELAGGAITKWIRSLGWTELSDSAPMASAFGTHQWWTGIPLTRSDGALIGVFCVSQNLASAPTQPSRYAADLALRLKPLLDCIHRDLIAAVPANTQVQTLTERSAELEWLFKVTSNLKGGVDNKKVLQELVAAATSRLNSALGILYVPDKHLTVKHENDKEASASVLEAWSQTRDHLITWVQRQRSPLVVNSAGREGKGLPRCKVLCVPVVREAGRVIGLLAFYNLPTAANYSNRQAFLARHIGLQAASIVEAQFDLMTGLYTRSGLDQVYSGLLDTTDLIESSVIYLDIDHTHLANEQHGFELGNELIVRIADLLSAPLLPDDALAARISGDRFAIVLPRSTSADAMKIAEGLQTAASQLVIGPVKEAFDVSISCGVCALVPVPEELARAIAAAEMACKSAKNHGGRSVKLYVFEDGSMMRRHADALAVGQLRSALKADRLLLYAQRIAPLQNRSLPGGYELLLRLRDEDGTLVSPGPLIEAARRYQLLPTIDRWVMQRALQMLAPYRGMLRSRGLGMSINLSGQSICDETFIQHFSQALKNAKLPRHSVSVELTEQAAITNLASAAKMVTRLGALGCLFAMDDFGTGANSLTYLKALQVYRVKIDGSFVRDIQSDRNSKATVNGIVELAKGLGIETVAEHVENDEIAQEVRRLGVDYAQGYAFGRPTPLDEVLESLAQDESKRLHKLFLET